MNLFVVQDLEDPSRTRMLAPGDLDALRTVARWIKTFVARPNKDLGRAGSVCPFVPEALERMTLVRTQPIEGDDATYKSVVVVFTDLPADRVGNYLDDDHIRQLARRWYDEDGIVLGQFHERNEGSAIYNPRFHPFKAPVPFLLMRQLQAAIS
jgi:hypothetical protein